MAATSAVSSGLASRYATALFELSKEQDATDPVLADLQGLAARIDESEDLRRLISSPLVNREQHVAAIEALALRLNMHELTRKFLGTLAQNRRLFALVPIIAAFRETVARARGEVDAEVVSAVPLDEAELEAVRRSVSAYAKAPVNLASRVDPSLLGGLVVRVGSRMVDGSLKNKLQHLETSLRGIS